MRGPPGRERLKAVSESNRPPRTAYVNAPLNKRSVFHSGDGSTRTGAVRSANHAKQLADSKQADTHSDDNHPRSVVGQERTQAGRFPVGQSVKGIHTNNTPFHYKRAVK